jgi:lipopolysaccharide/colanic/teichoic acid biosynthesis glycosyltransferase
VGANLRLKRPASQTRVFSRVALWDVAWGGASPLIAFFLRDGLIKSPEAVAIYCGVASVTSLLVFQGLQTSSPIYRYFSIKDALGLLKACVLIAALSAVLAFLFTRLDEAPRSIPVLHFILLAAGLFGVRLLARLRQTQHENRGRIGSSAVKHVLVIQASRLAWFFSKMLEELVPGQFQIVAILDERPELQQRSLNGYPIVGAPEAIEEIVDEYATHGIKIDKVVIAAKPEVISKRAWDCIARVCGERQIELDVLPDQLMPGLSLDSGNAVAQSPDPEACVAAPADLSAVLARPFWRIKRAVDLSVALLVSILTLPIAAAVFAIALLDVGVPVIFWQQRVGRDGAPLRLYKFRTLQTLFDRHTKEKRDAHDPSPIGEFLQKSRLDELPQLWNIIHGDMSLIGPRPLLPVDQPDEPAIRLMVRPGLSGWAQVCGGKLITTEEKTALDEWYIRHATLWLDIAIALRTVSTLLIGDRRDEKAISVALGEKLQGNFIALVNSIVPGRSEQRTGSRERVTAIRAAEMPGPRRVTPSVSATPEEQPARSTLSAGRSA